MERRRNITFNANSWLKILRPCERRYVNTKVKRVLERDNFNRGNCPVGSGEEEDLQGAVGKGHSSCAISWQEASEVSAN